MTKLVVCKINGENHIVEVNDDVIADATKNGHKFDVFTSRKSAEDHKSLLDSQKFVESALSTIASIAHHKRIQLVGNDLTKIGEYNIKDRIAGMEDRDAARAFADAEAKARGITADQLLDVWAAKSKELALAVTKLAADTAAALATVNSAKTTADITSIVEAFKNA